MLAVPDTAARPELSGYKIDCGKTLHFSVLHTAGARDGAGYFCKAGPRTAVRSHQMVGSAVYHLDVRANEGLPNQAVCVFDLGIVCEFPHPRDREEA